MFHLVNDSISKTKQFINNISCFKFVNFVNKFKVTQVLYNESWKVRSQDCEVLVYKKMINPTFLGPQS